MTLAAVQDTASAVVADRRWRAWLSFVCVGAALLACLPIVRAPVVADDLTVVARSIPVLQEGSLWDLVKARVEGNLNYQHSLPLAGVLEALQAWISIEVARLTPLSVSNVWALMRAVWVVVVLAAATGMASAWRQVWPGLRPARRTGQGLHLFAGVALIGCATLQVHATWSLDPVISLNVYAWPSVALSLLYLAMVGRILTSASRRPALALAAALVGSAAVLVYELSIGAAVGAGLATILVSVLSWREGLPWRRAVRQALVLTPTVLLPLVVLVTAVALRDESTDVYEGVQPRLGIHAVGTWLTGLVGVVPGIAWPRGLVVYGLPTLVSKSVAAAAVGVIVLLVVVLLSGQRARASRPERFEPHGSGWTAGRWAWAVPFVALTAYWFVGTALLAITVKQQDEIDYTPGNVYLFYVIGFVVVTLALQALLTSAERRHGARALTSMVLLGLPFSLYQAAYNTQLTSSMRAGQNFNFGVLASATEVLPEVERCAAWAQFAAKDLPTYYETWVAEAFDRYQEEYGQPSCTTSVTAHMRSGASQREALSGGGSFWWATSPEAVMNVARHPGSAGVFTFSITLANAPCTTPRNVVVMSPSESNTVTLNPEQPTANVEFVLPAGTESVDIRFSTRGPVCRIPTDSREFMVLLQAPVVTGYSP